MKNTLMVLALLGLFIAGCESTPRNEEPAVEENTEEPANEEATEEPANEGQDAKQVVYVLGVNGMD